MALNRRIPRQVAKHLTRYLILTLLVALGSVALITLNLITDTLQYSFDRLGETGHVEDVRAWLISDPVNPDSLGQKYHFEIESRTSLDTEWRDGVTLRIFDQSDKVDRPIVLHGRDLINDHEILLNPAFATEQSLAVGDLLTLSGTTFRICGLITLPDYIYPVQHETDLMTDPRQFGIAVITKRAMKILSTSRDLDEDATIDMSYGIRTLPGHGDIKELMKDHYGLVRWMETKDNPRITMVKGEIAGLRQMTSSLPAAIYLINCILLASILWRMLRQEFPYIGTLRALGLSRGEILRHYLVLPLAIAVTGSLLGTGGGLALSRPTLVYYTTFFNLPVDQTRIDPILMLVSILTPIVLLMATASFVILRAVRLPPQALMRGYKRRPKAMLLEKLVRFRKVRFETKFRVRQSVRSSGKLFAAVIGVAFATMLLLMVFLIQDSYNYMIEEGIKGTFRYAQNYVFKSMQNDNSYGGEPYQMLSAKTTGSGEAIVIQGLTEGGQLLHLADGTGQPIELKHAVITRLLADKLKLNVGNTLSWTNDIDGEIYFVRVGAIAEIFTLNAVFLPLDEFNDLFDLPEGSFRGIYSDTELDISSEDIYLNEEMGDVLASFEAYAGIMKVSLLSMGLVSSLMALLILYILIALLIEENSRSISLLKILGYDSAEIRHLILRTFDLPVVVGFLVGIPLLLTYYGRMLESSFEEIDMTMPLRLSPFYLAIGFVLLYSTYILTRIISGRKIFRISMADGLKTMQE